MTKNISSIVLHKLYTHCITDSNCGTQYEHCAFFSLVTHLIPTHTKIRLHLYHCTLKKQAPEKTLCMQGWLMTVRLSIPLSGCLSGFHPLLPVHLIRHLIQKCKVTAHTKRMKEGRKKREMQLQLDIKTNRCDTAIC